MGCGWTGCDGGDTVLPSCAVNRHRTQLAATALGALLLCLLLPICVEAESVTREELRAVANSRFTQEQLERGRAYRSFGYVLFFVQMAATLSVVWGLAMGPVARWRAWALRWSGGRNWLARVWVLLGLMSVLAVVRFPFSVARFKHASDYGLRTDSLAAFALDWLKGTAIGWGLVLLVGLIVLGLFARYARSWWARGAVAVSILAVAYVALSPIVIDPLFNRFTPLEDPVLETRLLELAREGGIEATEVLVADASRRTRAVNAYFTGVGSTRRIVLYDTLIESFTADEIAGVVAHEVGHWRHHHVRLGLTLGLLATALGLWVAHGLLSGWVRSERFGLQGRSDPLLAIPAYALYVSFMLVAVAPGNVVSRAMEARADRAALELTGDPDTQIRTHIRLASKNLSDVLPPAWIEWTLYTHPSTARRIHMAERFR